MLDLDIYHFIDQGDSGSEMKFVWTFNLKKSQPKSQRVF